MDWLIIMWLISSLNGDDDGCSNGCGGCGCFLIVIVIIILFLLFND